MARKRNQQLDEASLYLQATLAAVWAPRRQTPTVPVHPGREKICFYGSLNLRTAQETVWEAETMNSQITADYLQHLLEVYPEGSICSCGIEPSGITVNPSVIF